MVKICDKCSVEKDIYEFTKCKPCSNGVRGICKECTRKNKIIYDNLNIELHKEKAKKYRLEHIDKHNEYLVAYNRKQEVKLKKREYYDKNIEYYRNVEKTTERKLYRKIHNKNSIYCKWRSVLNSSLQRMGKKKEGHTIDLLGYSALNLKTHISMLFTEGMSWSNHGEWHIDHIIPVSSFDKETHPSIVNALSNLQPLWATTRVINGITYIGNQNKYNNTLIKN